MTTFITEKAQERAEDLKYTYSSFAEEFRKQTVFFEDGFRLGRPFEQGGTHGREIVMCGGKILMRYDEPEDGVVEIFDFVFASSNR